MIPAILPGTSDPVTGPVGCVAEEILHNGSGFLNFNKKGKQYFLQGINFLLGLKPEWNKYRSPEKFITDQFGAPPFYVLKTMNILEKFPYPFIFTALKYQTKNKV
jgi:hypothetical protein